MAYAAVISLKHTIERLKNSTNPQIITKSAYDQELELLRDVLTRLDGSSNISINRTKINELDADIREAVCKLEDVLQFNVLHHSLPPSLDDQGLKQAIDLFFTTVKKLREEYMRELDSPLMSGEEADGVSPLQNFGGNKSTMVGLSDHFDKIREELLNLLPVRKIVSLVGMAGIGKTILARKIYETIVNVRHFNLTAWVSLGRECQIKNVLVNILDQIDRSNPTNMEEDMTKLVHRVHRSLYGRRYFIVLDDIWNTSICDYLITFFPENKNGSRVLLTTRLQDVAYSTAHRTYQMRLLSNEESWNLFSQKVFADEQSFSRELEKAGRKIAENCEGLPLLILAVANILRGHEKTEEYWKKVAEKKTTTFPDAYDAISKVLSSSYEYLPQYLKACFLYMGVFPQSSEIPIHKLMNLWSVEDFLDPNESQAMECVKKLVSQSLLIVCKLSLNDEIKSCKLHSAYWHLCVKEARKNKFLHVLNNFKDGSRDYIESQRRLSVQNNVLFGIKEVYDSIAAASTARSLLCTGEDHEYPVPICLNLMLLKVLDALAIRFYEFPTEVLELLELRYLALTHEGNLPCFISQLQNLQCLIFRKYHNIKFLRDPTTYLPKEIWDMQELRHLWIMGSNLPKPSSGALLPNLLTLYVDAHCCSEEALTSIPYLKKLVIKTELKLDAAETINCLEHIGVVHELESLKCVVVNPRVRSQVVAPPGHLSNLPRSLKKLSLNGLGYSWEYMSAIGLLPNLQVLKLQCYAFQGPEWETEVGEFRSLEFLLLEDIDLVHWTTDDEKCFPRLQRLMICHCYKLREIPWQLGDIATLKSIEIVDCSPFGVASAQQIEKEQSYCGNDYLQILINSSWK